MCCEQVNIACNWRCIYRLLLVNACYSIPYDARVSRVFKHGFNIVQLVRTITLLGFMDSHYILLKQCPGTIQKGPHRKLGRNETIQPFQTYTISLICTGLDKNYWPLISIKNFGYIQTKFSPKNYCVLQPIYSSITMRNVIFVEIHVWEHSPIAQTRGLDFVEKVACQKVTKREENQVYLKKICLNALRAQTRGYY